MMSGDGKRAISGQPLWWVDLCVYRFVCLRPLKTLGEKDSNPAFFMYFCISNI